ncbi:hypothetical protein [Synechococcus sp. EJ6-Ellesmere]|uniref:hypothetical protein n=1 Tax=Synechococcus sp. EJ6-Ellesmere TaxID=2823734 RepID=UPI0020CFB53A|nr:hypothetical protein [Synechococcus sp. EJ6-Ellesmere]MCP9826050.1 hypothetical protein [Synechococcus sp. EJ6-Ellesmere]
MPFALNGTMERLCNNRPSLSELRAAIASAQVGLTLMVCILLGIGTHPIAEAAVSAAEDSAQV